MAWWRNGRASDFRLRGQGFDSWLGHSCVTTLGKLLPRRRQSSLLYGVVKPGTFTFQEVDQTKLGERLWKKDSRARGLNTEDATCRSRWRKQIGMIDDHDECSG